MVSWTDPQQDSLPAPKVWIMTSLQRRSRHRLRISCVDVCMPQATHPQTSSKGIKSKQIHQSNQTIYIHKTCLLSRNVNVSNRQCGFSCRLRLLCFHNAGSSEDMFSSEGSGIRKAQSPLLVSHCPSNKTVSRWTSAASHRMRTPLQLRCL